MPGMFERVRSSLAGRYELDRELGRGGMAIVYLARDVRHGRMVALKVLKSDVGETVSADRFAREIRTAANLTHPHILSVHDSGTADGLLFYVMPFVEGESLRQRLERNKRLPVAEAARIVIQVAHALDYAHRRNVVHRDIKPENILLHDDQAFVADFGIASVIADGTAGLTQTGMVIGTLAYMSPEQTTGAPLDGRSDLYSLGCVLYEALAGIRPSARPLAGGRVLPRLRNVQPWVPATVEAVVTKALAIDPADRFRQASEFADALDQAVSPVESAGAESPTVAIRVHRPPIRYSVAAVAIAVAALGLLLFRPDLTLGLRDAGGSSPQQSTRTTPAIAVLPFVNIGADATTEYFSDGMTEELIGALSRLQGLRVTSRTSAFAFKGTSRNVRDIGVQLGVGWVLEGSVRHSRDRLRISVQLIDVRDDSHKWSETYDRELRDVFTIQNEIAAAIVAALSIHFVSDGAERLVSAPTRNLEAYKLYLQGRFFWNKRDEAGLLRSIDCFNQALSLDPGYALAHAGLGDAYAILGGNGHRPPTAVYPQAKAAAQRAISLDPSLAQPHATLGLALSQYEWQFELALREFRIAEQLNPSYATIPHWRAWALLGLGRVEEALTEMRRAQMLDPLSLIINTQIGTMLHYLRRYEEADAAYRQALELDRGFPMAHAYLAANHARGGQFERALAEARLASAQFGEGSAIRVLGPIQAAAGLRTEAEAALEELAALSQRAYVSDLDFATIHALLGNRDEAFTWLDRAVKAHASDVYLIRVDPLWDPMRTDPRFQRLLVRMNMGS